MEAQNKVVTGSNEHHAQIEARLTELENRQEATSATFRNMENRLQALEAQASGGNNSKRVDSLESRLSALESRGLATPSPV